MAWGEIIDSGNSFSEASPGTAIESWVRVKNHGVIKHPYRVTCQAGYETQEIITPAGEGIPGGGTKSFIFTWIMGNEDMAAYIKVYHREDSEWIFDAEKILDSVTVILPPEPESTGLSLEIRDVGGVSRGEFFSGEEIVATGRIVTSVGGASQCGIEIRSSTPSGPLLGTDRSDANGYYEIRFSADLLPVNEYSSILAVFFGNDSYEGSQSSILQIYVEPGVKLTELSINVTDALGNVRDTFFEWENIIVWGKLTVAGTTEAAPSCDIEVWTDALVGTDKSDDDGDYRVQFNAGTLPLGLPIYISAVFNGNDSYGSSISGTVTVVVNPAEPPVEGQPYVRVVSYSWSQEDIPNRDPVTVGIPVEVRIIVRNDGELPGDCRAAIYEYGGSILATTGGLTLSPNQDEIVTTTFVPTLPNYTYDIGLVGQHFEFEV